jgi:hypothetical protein
MSKKKKTGTGQVFADSAKKPVAKTQPQPQPKPQPPPQPKPLPFRDLRWVPPPPQAWSGDLFVSLANASAWVADGVKNLTLTPTGRLVGGNGADPVNITVTLHAPAIPGFQASTRTAVVAVQRRERFIRWNLRDVWEVGEEITVDGIGAVCEPDGAPLTLEEPGGAFTAPEDDVEVRVSADEDDYFQAWSCSGTVKVVDDLLAHAEDTAIAGMKDGSLWANGPANGGVVPRLADWNADVGGMKTQGKAIMTAIKDMTGGQLIAHMDGLVGDVALDKQDERATKPTKQFPNVLWKLPNGLQVRYKPNGDGFGADPKFCIEARTVPGFTTGQAQVGFKVSADGEPAAPGAGKTLVPDWVNDAGLYDEFMTAACNTTHLVCKPKKAQAITRASVVDILANVPLKAGQLGIAALDKAVLSFKIVGGAEVKTGTKLPAGDHEIEATAAPTLLYDGATETFTVTVKRAPQTITWQPPVSAITVGTSLGAAGVLNATSSSGAVPSYKRAAGANAVGGKTMLAAGPGQQLVAWVKQSETHEAAQATITLDVNLKPQTVTWALPKGFDPVVGAPLGAKLFEAASALGKVALVFTTNGRAVDKTTADMPAGEHTVIATAAATAEYAAGEARVTFTVRRKSPRLKWPATKPIAAGMTLAEAGVLTATAAPGLDVQYRLAAGGAVGAGDVLGVGDHAVIAWTAQTDAFDAAELPPRVLTVNLREQEVQWEPPRNIEVGTSLGQAAVLAATALGGVVPRYTLGDGSAIDGATKLAAGEGQRLIAIADATEIYARGETEVTINVRRLPQTITWTPPGSIVAGARLEPVLTARAEGDVDVTYSTADGTAVDDDSTLEAGEGQVLFARTAQTDVYLPGEAEITIDVTAPREAEAQAGAEQTA